MLQWKGYVPGAEGAVNDPVFPGWMSPVSNWPAVSEVTVCVDGPLFSTVTVAPALTEAFVSEKSCAVIVEPPDVVLDFLLLLLHAARPSATSATTMRVKIRRCMPLIRSAPAAP